MVFESSVREREFEKEESIKKYFFNRLLSRENAAKSIKRQNFNKFQIVESTEEFHINEHSEIDFSRIFYKMNLRTRTFVNVSDEIVLCLEKINSFKQLKPNWDEDGADLISESCIKEAIRFLIGLNSLNIIPHFCAPLRGGGIQLDFKGENFFCEIEIHQDDNNFLIVYDKESNIVAQYPFLKTSISNIAEKLFNYLKL